MPPPRIAVIAAWLVLATAAPAALAEPDPIAGRAVVVGGSRSTVTPCFTCHGLDGVGDSAGAFPRLTGQAAFYLYKQLIDYASGARPNDVMTPIARQMTEDQMENVASYYAIVDAPHFPRPEIEPGVLERGRTIYEEGLPDAGLQACVFCHGRDGSGIPPLFPYLAGQYAPYAELQLLLWKRDVRNNDPLNVMRDIALKLSDEDIRVMALYLEWLRPPAVAESPPAPPEQAVLGGPSDDAGDR
jgi:cytochrome c553